VVGLLTKAVKSRPIARIALIAASFAVLVMAACGQTSDGTRRGAEVLVVTDSLDSVADKVESPTTEGTVPCRGCGSDVSDPKDLLDNCVEAAIGKCGDLANVTDVGLRDPSRPEGCTCTIVCERSTQR
jgi:hypothetical protein